MDTVIAKGPQNGIYLPQTKYGNGVPIIRIDDFQIGWIRTVSDLRRVAAKDEEQELYGLRVGDLLLNRVNSVSHLGKVMIVDPSYTGAIFESNMMRISVSPHVNGEYIELYLMSEIGRSKLIANCKHAVNQASINQGDVKATPLPLLSSEEQSEIVSRVHEALQKAEAVEHWCGTELKRSAALRQSILKQAFAGNLVDQDPSDEPASALLARIAKGKAAAAPKKKTIHRRKAAS